MLVHDLTTLYCILHSDDIAQIKVSTQGQKKIKNRFFFFKRFRNGKKDAGKKRILVRYPDSGTVFFNTAKQGKTGCRPDNGAFNNTPSEDGKIEDHVIVAQRLVKCVTSLTEDDSEHVCARSIGRGGSDPWQ